MDIKKTIDDLDILFAQKRHEEVGDFLISKIAEANTEGDTSSIITLVNELIGFYRKTSRYKDVIAISDYIIRLMKEIGLEGTVSYATTLLNVATAYREAGKVDESIVLYNQVMDIYKENLSHNDMRLASLYNNLSLVYSQKNDYDRSYELLTKALTIVINNKGTEIEEAITYINIAKSLLKINKVSEGVGHIEKALNIFEKEEGSKNFHYSAALSTMGEYQYLLKNYTGALDYFKKALTEIELNVGKNTYNYAVTCENISRVYDKQDNKEHKMKYQDTADKIYKEIIKK